MRTRTLSIRGRLPLVGMDAAEAVMNRRMFLNALGATPIAAAVGLRFTEAFAQTPAPTAPNPVKSGKLDANGSRDPLARNDGLKN